MIDAVEKIIESKAMRTNLEQHRFPSPREFAEEIVEFFYGLVNDNLVDDEPDIYTAEDGEPIVEDNDASVQEAE
jgi:hypothetical protein